MENRKKNIVYVNPNFAGRELNKMDARVLPTEIRMHINPNFKGNIVAPTHCTSNNQLLDSHKIHINPKLLTMMGSLPSVNIQNVESKHVYVVNSKNKFIKMKNTEQAIEVPTDVASTKKTQLLKNHCIKKPSYSLVRKDTSKQQNNVTSESMANKIQSIKPSLINTTGDNIWKRKVELKTRTYSAYRLSKRKSLSNKSRITNNSLSITSPAKSKLLSTLNKSQLRTTNYNKYTKNGTTAVRNISQSVYIGGSKYFVKDNVLQKSNESKTARNQPTLTQSKQIKRINLCGITYVRKSDSIFVRDNRMKKPKKINITCPIFRRLGICKNHTKNKCPLIHDPKNISICQKFLKGLCNTDECHLSHQVVKEKMPTCKFFLEGCCTKEKCPYLHVKLNENANICQDFLNGYCKLGDNCNNKHLIICPNSYKYSKCDKTRCTYPHKLLTKTKQLHLSDEHCQPSCTRDNSESSGKVPGSQEPQVKASRYFDGNEDLDNTGLNEVAYKGRSKLGDLPSYISLS